MKKRTIALILALVVFCLSPAIPGVASFASGEAFTPMEAGAWFISNGKLGFMNLNGRVVLEARFDSVAPLGDPDYPGIPPLFLVREGEKLGVVSREGELLLPPAWGRVQPLKDPRGDAYLKDFFLVSHSPDGLLSAGMCKKGGQLLTDIAYHGVIPFLLEDEVFFKVFQVSNLDENGSANNFLYGLLDPEGRPVIPVEYASLDLVGNSLLARSSKEQALYRKDGTRLLYLQYGILQARGDRVHMRNLEQHSFYRPDGSLVFMALGGQVYEVAGSFMHVLPGQVEVYDREGRFLNRHLFLHSSVFIPQEDGPLRLEGEGKKMDVLPWGEMRPSGTNSQTVVKVRRFQDKGYLATMWDDSTVFYGFDGQPLREGALYNLKEDMLAQGMIVAREKDQGYRVWDLDFNELYPGEYEDIQFTAYTWEENGKTLEKPLILVIKDGKLSFLDSAWQPLTPFQLEAEGPMAQFKVTLPFIMPDLEGVPQIINTDWSTKPYTGSLEADYIYRDTGLMWASVEDGYVINRWGEGVLARTDYYSMVIGTEYFALHRLDDEGYDVYDTQGQLVMERVLEPTEIEGNFSYRRGREAYFLCPGEDQAQSIQYDRVAEQGGGALVFEQGPHKGLLVRGKLVLKPQWQDIFIDLEKLPQEGLQEVWAYEGAQMRVFRFSPEGLVQLSSAWPLDPFRFVPYAFGDFFPGIRDSNPFPEGIFRDAFQELCLGAGISLPYEVYNSLPYQWPHTEVYRRGTGPGFEDYLARMREAGFVMLSRHETEVNDDDAEMLLFKDERQGLTLLLMQVDAYPYDLFLTLNANALPESAITLLIQ